MGKKYPYGKNILITGATSGLWKAAADYCAGKGFRVWGVSRRCAEEYRKVGRGEIRLSSMDVTVESSVKEGIEKICAQAGEIGIVLHCAGYGIGGAAEDTPIEMVRGEMETNYFGVLRVNQALLPHMREQGRGLVLVVSSVAGFFSIPFQSHYSSTKYALEAYVEALRIESRPFGIRACLIEPGDTRTEFTGARKVYSPEESVYHSQCVRSIKKMEKDEQNGKPPDSVAKAAERLARKKNPPIRRAVGWEYKLFACLKQILPSGLIEKILTAMYLPKP